MPKWWCPECSRLFSSATHFHTHLDGKKNVQCREYYDDNPVAWPTGEYDPASWVAGAPPPLRPRHRAPTAPPLGSNDTPDEPPLGSIDSPDAPPLGPMDSPAMDIGSPDDGRDFPQEALDEFFMDLGSDSPDEEPPNPDKERITSINTQFKEYVKQATRDNARLPPELTAAIELINILNEEGAPISAYDKVMEWHMSNLKWQKKVTREALMKKLRKRYNMEDIPPKMIKTTLPACGTKLSIPCYDFKAVLRDMLTDPRIKDDYYLFFNDDPLAAPPTEWKELRDINDGLAYRMTYDKLIKPKPYTEDGRRRVLLPVIPYMDGCVTGQFMNLQLEIVKFTLGIFNKQGREKHECWRNMGAVPSYVASKQGAKTLIMESTHNEAADYLTDSDEEDDEDERSQDSGVTVLGDEEEEGDDEVSEVKHAQNLHHILDIILQSYRECQDSEGIEFDLVYKGKTHKLLFIPFVPFVKGDSVEQDKHCGKYGSRGKGVKQLCRHCCCPAVKTDEPYEEHERKTVTMIRNLKGEKEHQELSQSNIVNAWHKILFGLHNDEGIHGATPLEILHWIQLGMLKYTRDNIFNQTGKGLLGQQFNEVATHFGWLLQRQSDKSLPRTKFSNGVMKGKLMGHEHSGLILNCAAAFRSRRGRKVLLEPKHNRKKDEFFPDKKWVDDWLMLCETLLQMEAWLKKDVLLVDEVIRSKKTFREIMSMNKVIGKRVKKMGNKTFNFHGTMHVPQDMLNFGPAKVAMTDGDEMRHKKDKGDAKRTQKRPKTFEIQALTRIEERRLIDLGMTEALGRVRRDYFRKKNDLIDDNTLEEPKLSGVKALITFQWAPIDDWVWKLYTDMQRKDKYKHSPNVRSMVHEVAGVVSEYVEPLPTHSELLLPGGQVYRASPWFQGKPWYDWALFRYEDKSTGKEAVLPGHIRTFIDLRDIGNGNRTEFKPGIWLVVETVRTNRDQQEYEIRSDLFKPYLKNMRRKAGTGHFERETKVWHLERLLGPTAMVPDVGNKNPNAFLRVKSPKEWGDDLSKWINSEHTREFEGSQVR